MHEADNGMVSFNPMKGESMVSRRNFLVGGIGAALATAAAGCRLFTGAAKDYDENLAVFLSDPHVSHKPESHQLGELRKVVAKILRMDPLPRNCVVFGDIARSFGLKADYETSTGPLRELEAAGIRLTLGMGNHDRRGHFLELWPEYAKRTRVPGRVVTVADLGRCDLLMLDTLWESHQDETQHTEGDGQLVGDQWDWVRAELPRWPRPVVVCAHHSNADVKDGDARAFTNLLMDAPNVIGYVHGHNHCWMPSCFRRSGTPWGDRVRKRRLCLPSSGHWGDIGWVIFRTTPTEARADLTVWDYWYPHPAAAGETRPAIWDDLVREKQGRFCTFRW